TAIYTLSLHDALPISRRDRRVVTKRSLPERIVDLDGALTNIPHAFGGALALAYYAHRGDHHRHVLGAAAGHHRVDGDVLGGHDRSEEHTSELQSRFDL